MMDKVRRHYIFRGSVQAVGFRYKANYAASAYAVAGWVRNCYDGSVEMEAEGEPAAIDKVISRLRDDRYIFIEDMEVKEIPVLGERSFHIKSSW